MTTTDLLKKFRSKKTGIQNAQLVLLLINISNEAATSEESTLTLFHRFNFLQISWRRSTHTSTRLKFASFYFKAVFVKHDIFRLRESPTCPWKRKSEQKEDLWTESINVQNCHWRALVITFLELYRKNLIMTKLLLTAKVRPHILLFQIIFETEAALRSESVNPKNVWV